MALHFHKKPIILGAMSLKTLVTSYNDYTARVDYTVINEESYENCRSSRRCFTAA